MYLIRPRLIWLLYFTVGNLCSFAYGQGAVISLQPSQISKEISVNKLDIDYEEISVLAVTNQSKRSIRLAFDPHFINEPGGWTVLFRPKSRGASYPYSSTLLRTSVSESVTLAAGETAEFYVVFQPNGVVGQGRLQIPFYEESRPSQTLATAKISFVVSHQATATSEAAAKPKSLRVFPNPAIDQFFLEAPANTQIGRVEVHNTLGRKLRSFPQPVNDKEGYPIEDLPEGIYLISIFDAKGEKLKTFRLLHRRFGA